MGITGILTVEHRFHDWLLQRKWLPRWAIGTYGTVRCSCSAAVYRSRFMDRRASPSRIVARFLRPGDTYVDIGCANGEMLCTASGAMRGRGKLFGIDGRIEAVRAVQIMASQYGLAEIMKAEHMLLGNTSGRCEFIVNLDHPTSSSRSLDWVVGRGAAARIERVMVTQLSLDEWSRTRSLSAVDLVKIDVEGSEPDVIRGGLSLLARQRPVIVMEVAGEGRRDSLDAVWADLLAVGYSSCHGISVAGLRRLSSLGAGGQDIRDVVVVDEHRERHRELLQRETR